MMRRCSEDENIFYRNLGEKIRVLRKYKNFSQEKLARELNLTFQQIQKYESGVNRIPITKLLHICNLFETTPDFFLPAAANIPLKTKIWSFLLWLTERSAKKTCFISCQISIAITVLDIAFQQFKSRNKDIINRFGERK